MLFREKDTPHETPLDAAPLAERLRPTQLQDILGQDEALGDGSALS